MTVHPQDSRMRVVMLTTFRESCGIATYAEALVPALDACGVRVHVLAPTRMRGDPGRGDQPPRLWHRNRAFGFEALGVMQAVRDARPDLVHLQVNRSLFSSRFMLDFALLCAAHNLPLIATLHGRWMGSWGEDFKLWRLLTALRRTDLIVHNPAHRDELRRDRVHVIPHGIELPPARTLATARSALGIDPCVPVLTHCGFILPDKGIDEMLGVVARLRASSHPNLLYRVAGGVYASEASQRHFEMLRARAAELGIAEAMHMTGEFLPNDDLMTELQAATLLVLNYRTGSGQGASGAVRRALAGGRPVAVSRAPIFDDVREAVYTLAESLDDDLRGLLASEARLDALAARGRAVCEAQSWPKVAAAHGALYDRILRWKGSARP